MSSNNFLLKITLAALAVLILINLHKPLTELIALLVFSVSGLIIIIKFLIHLKKRK